MTQTPYAFVPHLILASSEYTYTLSHSQILNFPDPIGIGYKCLKLLANISISTCYMYILYLLVIHTSKEFGTYHEAEILSVLHQVWPPGGHHGGWHRKGAPNVSSLNSTYQGIYHSIFVYVAYEGLLTVLDAVLWFILSQESHITVLILGLPKDQETMAGAIQCQWDQWPGTVLNWDPLNRAIGLNSDTVACQIGMVDRAHPVWLAKMVRTAVIKGTSF